jgi:hypothetical protein
LKINRLFIWLFFYYIVYPQIVIFIPQLEQEQNGYFFMNYSLFSVIAIKAVQEQQTIIEKQQQEIDDLRKEIDEIKKIIDK